ncbi:hypothetical protein ACFT2C_05275 [Promicromonospora sp. NPDC057138]|uniref:hypothetical protein n=1 Tax=Promicromonospora sp. NPDC057138 TaxID=3346031 RepID=UPI00362C55CA
MALLTVSGCTASATDPTPTPSATTTTSAPPSVSPKPSPTTESELAAASAEALAHEYYRITDAVAADPTNLKPLKTVATSAELIRLRNTFGPWEDDGWHKTGTIQVIDLTTQSVSFDDSGQGSNAGPTVQIDVCYDVADVDVVDASGESQVDANRPDRAWERLWISNPDYDDDPESGWLVADRKTLEREPCAAR